MMAWFMRLKRGEQIFVTSGLTLFVTASALFGYMLTLKNLPTSQFPVHLTKRESIGETIFLNLHCDYCHMVYGVLGNYNYTMAGGPNLGGVGSRHTKTWLMKFLRNPSSEVPGMTQAHIMPVLTPHLLPHNELVDLVDFLSAMKAKPSNAGQSIAMPE